MFFASAMTWILSGAIVGLVPVATLAPPMVGLAAVAPLAASPAAPAPTGVAEIVARLFDEPVVWAGHQVVEGEKKIPVLGTLETRMDSYTLARVRRSGAGFVVEQTACRVSFEKVAGTKITM